MTQTTLENSDDRADLLGSIVDGYMERRARGEDPSIEDIASQHPEFAAVIRQSLTALEILARSETTEPAAPPAGLGFPIDKTLGDFRILREVGRKGRGRQGGPRYSPRSEASRSMASSSLPHTSNGTEFFRFAARLGIEAADALHHAHEEGILHRDVKPCNLLLDSDHRLFITDFGLARVEADAGLTMTGDLVGTLRYMSPEQALVSDNVVDRRSDVYSLGATLYELLTLRPACDGTQRRELLKQIAHREPTSPLKHNPRIPVELAAIVLKALEYMVWRLIPEVRSLPVAPKMARCGSGMLRLEMKSNAWPDATPDKKYTPLLTPMTGGCWPRVARTARYAFGTLRMSKSHKCSKDIFEIFARSPLIPVVSA